MKTQRQRDMTAGWIVFVLIAVLGLLYVKWTPYWNKAFVAASAHSIGTSILMGSAARPPAPSWRAAVDYAWAYGKAIWQAMVLGLLLGSAVQALLPPQWILRWLGRINAGSVLRGAVLAVPGMMCTCCAAPVVVGLRKANASAGAAIAFWLGNSVLNPATLVFIGFVLGWRWSALRLALGIVAVLGLALVANLMSTGEEAAAAERQLADIRPALYRNPFARWLAILARLAAWLIPEYIVLVLLLGAARAWLFPHVGPEVSDSLGWILAFAVAGTLFVIPTAGEVPIIQAMLSLGVGVGPAAVLLMVLPPISVPSLAMVGRAFRPRLLAVVTVGIVAIGVVGGLSAVALRF
ncbi:MAG TPA: permease [Stellaceae bacterium]|nr:permease [Stellaceae bacterium]